MKNSLQVRLSVGLSLVIALTGVVAAASSFVLAYEDAHELQDEQLKQVTRLVEDGQLRSGAAPALPSRSDAEAEAQLIIEPLAASRFNAALPDGLHTASRDGQTWRLLLRTLNNGERIAVAQRTAVRDEIAFNSGWRTLLPLLALIPALMVMMRIVLRKNFAPLARLANRLDASNEVDPQTLRESRLPAEIQPFVASIERLLARLTSALDQQRRFVADAAHELRSPIAALTVQADNLAQTDLPLEARRRLGPLKDGLARTRALLDQLLSLARHQAGASRQAGPVSLDRAAREVVADLMAIAQARGCDLGFCRIEPVTITATLLDATTLVRNAVDNALRYSPAGGAVNIDVFNDGDDAVLVIEDAGPGIPADQLERVFDPFYRLPGAADNGSGLGLAIVRSIADRWGGRVQLTNIGDGVRHGLRFEYRQRRATGFAGRV